MFRNEDSVAARAAGLARHLVFGSFVAAFRARRGRGYRKSREQWDREYREGEWKFLDGLAERSHHMVLLGYVLGQGEPKKILDVGCGTGGLLDRARKFALGGYTGIDISEAAVNTARERFRDVNIRFPIVFETADFESFEKPVAYDVIIFNESISYARNPLAVMERFRRHLRPGGFFLVSLCYNWWQEPIMKRITRAFTVLHSADVSNERGLTWQIRMLSAENSLHAVGGNSWSRTTSRRWRFRLALAERTVAINENLFAFISVVGAFVTGLLHRK